MANALIASPARAKRVIADSFSKHFINDRWLALPAARRDEELQREVRDTRNMVECMNRNGVPVRYSWPITGHRYHRLLARNHKKLVVIDDRISYIGGINFSDHNFAWHDFMVRIENPTVAAYLRDDLMPRTDGPDRWHLRIAANALSVAAREVTDGPASVAEHHERLAALGFGNDRELSEAIRAGAVDGRFEAVLDAVAAGVADSLAIANPTYGD